MANYERLSPGVYRGPNGALVHKGGRPINPQEARQMQNAPRQMKQPATGGPAYAGGTPQSQFNEQQNGVRQDFFAGGNPQFSERTGSYNGAPMGNPDMFAGGNPQFNERRGQMMQYQTGNEQFNQDSARMMGMPSSQMRTYDYVAGRDGPLGGDPNRWGQMVGARDGLGQNRQSLGQPPQGWGPQQPPQGMPARPIASAPPASYMPPKGPQGGGAFAGSKAAGVTGAPPNKRRGLYGGQLGG